MISTAVQDDSTVEWSQPGEETIDAVFQVYQCSPSASGRSPFHKYNITNDGVQIINSVAPIYFVGYTLNNAYNSAITNPVFLYYRKSCPDFTGDEFDASATYSVDEQVYFVDSTGAGNFFKCVVATTAGQSPDTNPDSWNMLPIYDTFFQFCVYKAFADWLISDGQMDKAVGMYAIAQGKMDDEFDKIERQMGDVFPIKIQTHVSAQAANW